MAGELGSGDRAYRRGLVLGLSLAELFMILLFLVLMASVGVISYLNEKSLREKELATQLRELQEQFGSNILPEDFEKLVAQVAKVNELKQKLEEKEKQLSSLMPLKKAMEQRDKAIKNLREDLAKSEAALLNLSPLKNALDEIQLTTTEQKRLIDKLADAVANIPEKDLVATAEMLASSPSDIIEELASLGDLKNENQKLAAEKQQLAELVEAYGKARGDNPPCLYKGRNPDSPLFKTKPYKEIYSFDVLLKPYELTIVRRGKEPGNYGNEGNIPIISDNYFNRPISYTDFKREFRQYSNLGRNKKIQDYPCAFFVKAWWDKGMSSVEYENAMKQLGDVFFSDVMRSTQWPH